MRLLILLAVLLCGGLTHAQTLPVTYADLTPAKQAELVEAWKKNYKSEISALPPGQLPAPSVALPAPKAVVQTDEAAALRQHLMGGNHGFSESQLAGMSLEQLNQLHTADHLRKAGGTVAASSVASSSYQSAFTQTTSRTCVGPNCGTVQQSYQPAYQISQQGWYLGKGVQKILGR